ncbi:MAG: hypothetical protein ACR2LZ_10270 [Pyrinomonadaceae bacterium]
MNYSLHRFRVLYAALLLITGARVCELPCVAARQRSVPAAPPQQQPLPRVNTSPRRNPAEETRATSTQKNAEKLRRQRVQQAVLTLNETANDARKFEDQSHAARIQSLAADALWRFDEPAARDIFGRAWETATAHDRAAMEETLKRDGNDEAESFTSARDEVLAKIAARDVRLSEKYLRELLDEERKRDEAIEADVDASSELTPWGEMSNEGVRRLEIADGLLQRGDATRAAGILTPAIREGVSADLIEFMLRLRVRDAAQADAMFLTLLQTIGANVSATSTNELLLLSSYIVSPQFLVVFDESASQHRALSSSPLTSRMPPVMSPELRGAFYTLAAHVLAARMNAADGSPQETAALFFATARLLPFFEREAPHLIPGLRAQYDALAGQLEAPRRDALRAQSETHTVTPKNPTDPLRPILDRLERISDKAHRDSWLLLTVNTAARQKLWTRARDMVAEIEDAEAQRTARLIIKARQIENLSRSYAKDAPDDYERAAAFVRDADVPPLLRAWGYAQAAGLAASRGKRERAIELLSDAAIQAEAVENNSRQRVAAHVVVAKAAAISDPQRAWENLSYAVRAANALDNFTGDDLSLDVLPSSEWIETVVADGLDVSVSAAPFRLDDLFATMTRLDFERALTEARTLNGNVLRASALIAVARAELEKDEQPPKRKAAPKRLRASA